MLICFFIILASLGFAQDSSTQPTSMPMTRPAASYEIPSSREAAEQRIDELFNKWLIEEDSTQKEVFRNEIEILMRSIGSEREDIYDAFTVGGSADHLQIKLPESVEEVQLTPLFTFRGPDPFLSQYEVVTRRLNRDTLEVWTEDRGWLIDANGKLLNEATPPRRDGKGREWLGAFLPDGRWVTTDLFENDQTLTFFSRNGKWLREKAGNKILSGKVRSVFDESGLIDWARSDAEGKGWIVRISHLGIAWVSPSGEVEPLKGAEPWSRTFKRELGPRGSYLHPVIPDDSGELLLMKESPGHGFGVLYPHYSLHHLPVGEDLLVWAYSVFFDDNRSTEIFSQNLYGGTPNFGFWPNSTNIWINGRGKSWFFDKTGKCLGILQAERIADTADGQGMWFESEDGSIVKLDKNLAPAERKRLLGPANKKADIWALHDDIQSGIFKIGPDVVFAKF